MPNSRLKSSSSKTTSHALSSSSSTSGSGVPSPYLTGGQLTAQLSHPKSTPANSKACATPYPSNKSAISTSHRTVLNDANPLPSLTVPARPTNALAILPATPFCTVPARHSDSMLGGSRCVKRAWSSASLLGWVLLESLDGVPVVVLQTAVALRKRCVSAEKGEREVWVEERHSMSNQPRPG